MKLEDILWKWLMVMVCWLVVVSTGAVVWFSIQLLRSAL